ncbi:MAG TPA: oxidoreductase, partial [Ktedonobacteraceae bacterium]|nr:oxidoreductase [Ktedonobacteraceae bacterium]
QGASTSVWAAIGKELDGIGGLYLEDCQESHLFDPAHPLTGYRPYALDPEHAERLWTISEKLVGGGQVKP